MENKEIKAANRKAFPKFILIVIASAAIGGLVGFYGAKFGLNMMTDSLKSAGAFFGLHIAPWLLLAGAIIVPLLCVPLLRSAKQLLASWDGEDEEISDTIDRKISEILRITGTALIVADFLLAASYSNGFKTFETENQTAAFLAGIAGFVIILVEAVVFQQKSVDAAKKTNPEKKASVYDTKFTKKWMDECDEAEKIMIGKSAIKAFSATNTTCSILSCVLAVCALFFGTGFLPSLVVCLIWLINQTVYCREAARLSKSGSRIS